MPQNSQQMCFVILLTCSSSLGLPKTESCHLWKYSIKTPYLHCCEFWFLFCLLLCVYQHSEYPLCIKLLIMQVFNYGHDTAFTNRQSGTQFIPGYPAVTMNDIDSSNVVWGYCSRRMGNVLCINEWGLAFQSCTTMTEPMLNSAHIHCGIPINILQTFMYANQCLAIRIKKFCDSMYFQNINGSNFLMHYSAATCWQ